MKSIMLFAFGFILCFEIKAQSEVQLPSFYNGCGIIFSEKNKLNVHLDLGTFFEPSIEDVEKSEQILYENLRTHLENKFSNIREKYPLTKDEINEWKKTIDKADTKRQYRNFNRQYAGFINEKDERLIYIRLLNFSKPKQAIKYFENWKEEIIVGFGDFYEENTRVFVINIDRNEITK
jgi:hypothetical protein